MHSAIHDKVTVKLLSRQWLRFEDTSGNCIAQDPPQDMISRNGLLRFCPAGF